MSLRSTRRRLTLFCLQTPQWVWRGWGCWWCPAITSSPQFSSPSTSSSSQRCPSLPWWLPSAGWRDAGGERDSWRDVGPGTSEYPPSRAYSQGITEKYFFIFILNFITAFIVINKWHWILNNIYKTEISFYQAKKLLTINQVGYNFYIIIMNHILKK